MASEFGGLGSSQILTFEINWAVLDLSFSNMFDLDMLGFFVFLHYWICCLAF